MTERRVLAAVFGTLAAVGAAVTIMLALSAPQRQTVVLKEDPRIMACAQTFLDDLCGRDLEGASQMLAGGTQITAATDQSAVEKLLWDCYWDGLDGTLDGVPYAQGSFLAVDARVTYPDMEAVIQHMGTLTEALLQQRASQAEAVSEIYDAEGSYRQEILDEVVLQAARTAVEETTEVREKKVTLKLVYDAQAWKIVPGKELRDLLSGSMDGGQGE